MNKKAFKIEGMTCSACANRVERFVEKLDGVDNANVNFATETLSVEFDETKLNNENIEAAVVKAGYKLIKEEEKADGKKKLDVSQLPALR